MPAPKPYDRVELGRPVAGLQRLRAMLAATVSAVVVGSLLVSATTPVQAKADGAGLRPQVEPLDKDGGEVGGKAWPERPRPAENVPEPAWPKAAAATVVLPTASQRRSIGDPAVRAGDLPVTIRRADDGGRVSVVRVEVLDRAGTPERWRDGVLIRLSSAQTGRVTVSVDYRGFRFAYGGQWASRLRLWQLPPCALAGSITAECHASPMRSRNDATTGTVTATVPVAGGAGTVVALEADDKGDSGDFKATSLAPSATWSSGGSTGDFSWSYPMRVPPGISGLQPSMALSYSSAGVDGRSSATNNQPSWVGEGFEYWPGYIERRYVPCAEDMADSPEGNPANNDRKTGDLCWRSDNAILNLNGEGSELIFEKGKGWHARSESGSKIEKVSGASNGDDNGEHWKVTAGDGTQYFFGRNHIPGETTSTTESANTVRVYGNHAEEPCHESAFASSACNQASRWNLDHVIDVRGNTISYWYDKELNKYSANLTDTAAVSYVRASTLTRIDYGTWDRGDGERSVRPVARVLFTPEDRCLSGCSDHEPQRWPDVPWDLECKVSAESCAGDYSPTFWSTRRLAKITTRVWDTTKATPAWQDVDSWTLTHSFPSHGDEGKHAGLWLDKIVHTGHVGGNVSMPPITFDPTTLPNRVLTKHNTTNSWHRIGNIITETGAKIQVTYSLPECTADNEPTPHTNTKLCYPVVGPDPFDPDGPDITEWWHKYVVRQVSESDVQLTNGHQAPVKNTYYTYVGAPAWHYADDDGLIKQKYKTWSQFRGYATVKTRVGDTAGKQTLTETRYLRGMHGDREKPSGGTRTVTVDASIGNETVRDEDQFAGMVREQIVYNGTESKPVSKAVNVPWLSPATATRTIHKDTVTARFTDTKVTYKAEALGIDGADGWRIARTNSEFSDTYGTVESTSDDGDIDVTGDEKCTTHAYNRNTTKNITRTVKRITTTALPCGRAPVTGDDVISDDRNYFDGTTSLDTAPKYGSITKTERLKDWSNTGGTVWQTFSEATFDDYGRPTSATDIKGNTTHTSYKPPVGGPVTSVRTTSPVPFQWITDTDKAPYWDATVRITDPNGRTMDADYDPLGRVRKVWKIGWPRKGHETTPSNEYTYAFSPRRSDYPYITSKTLIVGGGYLTTHEIFDGLMRPRQRQTSAVGGGRVVTDTVYDELGRVEATYAAHAEPGDPSGTLWWEPEWSLRSLTRIQYDRANRNTAEILFAGDGVTNLVEKWKTITAYEGDRTKVTPPAGGTPTTTLTDIQGRTTQIRQHTTARGVDGPYQATGYTYDRKDKLVTVTDASKNEWTYAFDVKGRQIETVDPDRGKTTSVYNDFDELRSVTDARGKTLVYTYDQIGRKTAIYDRAVSDATKRAEWKYDRTYLGFVARGQQTEAIRYDNGGAYSRRIADFDLRYQPTGISIVIPATETGLGGTYDFAYDYSNYDGSPVSAFYPPAGDLVGESVDTVYDKTTGLPTSLLTNLPTVVTYIAGQEYTPYGEPTLTTRKIAAGVYVQDGTYYDTVTRRVTRTAIRPETASGTVSDRSYTYDPAGNITAIAEAPQVGPADNQCLRYDHLRRLTSAWTPAVAADCDKEPTVAGLGGPAPYWYDWTFDAIGNRRTETSHTAAGNTKHTYAVPDSGAGAARPHAVTAVTTEAPGQAPVTRPYGYDNAGNTTSRPGPTGSTQTLSWDTESRLATVADGTANTTNLYDADGARLIRRDATGATLYLPGMEVRRESGAITATRYYTFAGKTVASRTRAGGLQWLYNDHQGTQHTTVHALTQKVSIRRQTPYGQPRGTQPVWPNQKGFVGGDLDPTGLTHIGAREYDPALGRFISVDPVMDLADPQQWHAYAYANNSPITNSDPTGLIRKDPSTGGSRSEPASNGAGEADGGGIRRKRGKGDAEIIRRGDRTYVCIRGYFCLDDTQVYNPDEYLSEYYRLLARWRERNKGGDLEDHQFMDAIANACDLVTLGTANCSPDTYRNLADLADAKAILAYEAAHGVKGTNTAAAAVFAVLTTIVDLTGSCLFRFTRGGASGRWRNSFSGDTRVLLADGTHKKIKDITVGDNADKVIATDPKTGEQGARKVTHLSAHQDDLYTLIIDGQALTTTEDHPFWNVTDRRWDRADELDPGDLLRTPDGTTARVQGFAYQTHHIDAAYNLTVDGLHTYYVIAGSTPVLVHNDDPFETSRQARLDAMRQAGLPTSLQPRSATYYSAGYGQGGGYQYVYDYNGKTWVVTDNWNDLNADTKHGPHWEVGEAKPRGQTDSLGRLRVDSNKTKAYYGGGC